MAQQVESWTCSACALTWVINATGLDPSYTREQCVKDIGHPRNINKQHGLMDGSGAQLQRVLAERGQPSEQAWLGFDAAYELAQHTTGMIGGAAWYHWVALRGTSGDAIWIANSAQGYKSVWYLLTRDDYARLGPFSVVTLVRASTLAALNSSAPLS